jgi:hypothetical protein
MPPHHRHHRPPHHHHHRQRISNSTVERSSDVLARFVGARAAAALVEQAIYAPPEPTALFLAATASTANLADALAAYGIDLTPFGEKLIDPDSELHSLRIAADAAALIGNVFPKDVDGIVEGLTDGPDEMCAVAIVLVLNIRLGAALAETSKHPEA